MSAEGGVGRVLAKARVLSAMIKFHKEHKDPGMVEYYARKLSLLRAEFKDIFDTVDKEEGTQNE